jgi:hypothetical protein
MFAFMSYGLRGGGGTGGGGGEETYEGEGDDGFEAGLGHAGWLGRVSRGWREVATTRGLGV